jgi:hypothetical protein
MSIFAINTYIYLLTKVVREEISWIIELNTLLTITEVQIIKYGDRCDGVSPQV